MDKVIANGGSNATDNNILTAAGGSMIWPSPDFQLTVSYNAGDIASNATALKLVIALSWHIASPPENGVEFDGTLLFRDVSGLNDPYEEADDTPDISAVSDSDGLTGSRIFTYNLASNFGVSIADFKANGGSTILLTMPDNSNPGDATAFTAPNFLKVTRFNLIATVPDPVASRLSLGLGMGL